MKTAITFLLLLIGLSVGAQTKKVSFVGSATIASMSAIRINVPAGQSIKSTLYRIEFDWCSLEKIVRRGWALCSTGRIDKFCEVDIRYDNGGWAHLSLEQLKLIYYSH